MLEKHITQDKTTYMSTKAKKHVSGFTLVETLITTVVLTIAAFGIISSLIWIQYTAEDNLYESTALTVALSTLEQMKSMSVDSLERDMGDLTFELNMGANGTPVLTLGADNELSIPIVTNDGSDSKTMLLTLNPSIQALAGDTGFWLRVEYKYNHPRGNRIRTNVVGCVRSRIPNF